MAASRRLLASLLSWLGKLLTLCHSVLDVIHGVEVTSCELCCAFTECAAEKSFGYQLIVKVEGGMRQSVENHHS